MSHYYADSGQLDKGITAYQLYCQTYPRDPAPFTNLAIIYNQLGQFDNGLENAKRAMELDPDMLNSYSQVASAYAGLNRIEEARATINSVFQHKGSTKAFHVFLASLDWSEGKDKLGDIEKELQAAADGDQPGAVLEVLSFRLRMAGARGEMHQARDFARQVEDAQDRLQLKGRANVEAFLSTVEAVVGNRAEADSRANDALRLSQTLQVLGGAATTFAVQREDQKALALANQIAREHPNDTMAINVSVPEIRAIAALRPANSAKPDPAKAVDLLNSAAVYARDDAGIFYSRALAYEHAGRYVEAQQDLEKVMAIGSHNGPDIVFVIAQLELGRVFQKQGDLPKARIAYQNFLAAWKDADPDLPLLHEAKAEYAKLQ
jgi:tetratricopeptide (TPR) repeat protein